MSQKKEESEKSTAEIFEISDMRNFVFNKCAAFCKEKDGFKSSMFDDFYEDNRLKLPLITSLKKSYSCNTKYWFFAFKNHPKSPAFCQLEKFKELKSGYFLAVSYKKFVAFFYSNISLPKKWDSVLEKIGYDDFVNFNVDKETEFKYLSMKNIDGADYVIKKKTFEGNNLRNNVSSFASSKFYVQTMRGSNIIKGDEKKGVKDRQTFSVNFGTAKFNQYESGVSIGKICGWVVKIVDQMLGAPVSDDYFMKNFALRMSPKSDLEPSFILFNFGALYDILEDPTSMLLKKDISVDKKKFEENLRFFEKTIPIKKEQDDYLAKENDYEVKIKIDNKKVCVSCKLWDKITISSSNVNDLNLRDFINDEGLFNVYFEKNSIVYSNGSYYQDANLKENVEWLLSFIHPCEKLNNRIYEKVDGYMDSPSITEWPSKSEFSFVEECFKDEYEVLICDDFLKEWADFVGIKENCVEFFACKGNGDIKSEDGTKSASCFQDVIGQAIKNLGNFYPTESQLKTKKTEWSKNYLQSKKKKRTIGDLDTGIELWERAMKNPQYKKISSLVVNYITKDGFESNFKAMKTLMNSANAKTDSVEPAYQQLMLVSNFVHSCIEMNVEPRVYCPKKIIRDDEDEKRLEEKKQKAKKRKEVKKGKSKK